MTSVRTCYCRHEGNAARRKDNDIAIHNGNRRPATAVSKKSIATSRVCGSGGESCKRARRVIDEGTVMNIYDLISTTFDHPNILFTITVRYPLQPNANRSVEAQPSGLVLSPETSTALENAERIINNAEIQLREVCAASSFDSAQRNRNTYSDEPPLDDEAEERLYVRELVTSKLHDASSPRSSGANGKASAGSGKRDSPRVTVRRIDLSAPKFRASRRRRADWSSLGYGSDGRTSRGRASPVPASSRDSLGDANEATARDDRARERRRTSSARGNACGIQIGPSVHIVDRELTRQNLEDVHISPDSSRAQSRANTATYTLRHDAIGDASHPEGAPRTWRVRLDTLQRERPIVEAATEAAPTNPASEKDLEKVGDSDSRRDDGRIESPKVRTYRQERRDRQPDPRDDEGAARSERLNSATSRVATKFATIETPRTDRSERLRDKARNGEHEGFARGGDTEIRYAEDGGIFCRRGGADCPRNDENIEDKIQAEEDQGDRSQPSLAGDASRKTGFPRRENIASGRREAESPYRTIDGRFPCTFDSHNGQDGPRDPASEDARRRSPASGRTDVSRVEDSLDEIDLYRPRLDDLDTILYSNDRQIERVVRAARNLSELLSGPEFTTYKLDEDERARRDAYREKLSRDSLDDNNKFLALNEQSARASILETELRNEDLTVSETHETDEDPRGPSAAGTKSSAFAGDNGSRGNYSKNSVGSSVFPASDASDDPRTSRDSDGAQRSAAKARLSEESMDRSDVTTFSGLVPALSSTRTETRRPRQEEVARDAKSSASKLFGREIRHPGKEHADDGEMPARRDAFQATDRLVAYILQDEKRSVEGKVASALREPAVTPAAVQKLLDHLREAESIRQTETLGVLRDILINVKSQPDQGSDASARAKASPIDGPTSRGGGTRQKRGEVDASENGRVGKNSYELRSPGGRSIDFSECRETRESVRSTARCESVQRSGNNGKGDTDRVESADVDAKNQMDKGVDEKNPEETLPRSVAGSLMRTSATEEAISRAQTKNNAGLIVDESKDPGNPDERLSVAPAFPETGENVGPAAHFEPDRGSKNNSKNNSKGNSEAESLKQISDIRSDDDDDDENLAGNLERLSTKIASARSRGKREAEAADSITTRAVSENKEDSINNKRLGEDKANDGRTNNDRNANGITKQAEQLIDARSSDVPREAAKEIGSEKTGDIITPADQEVLFVSSKVSEMRSERASSGVKFIDESPTKTDVNPVRSSTRKDTGGPREAETDPRHAAIKEKIDPANKHSADPPRNCVAPKSDEPSPQEIASRNKQISRDVATEDNSTRARGNEEIGRSMTAENRRIEVSGPRETTRNGRRPPIDLTERPRNYKTDVLSSSSSSVSSTLLDYDRSTNGVSSANARRVGTTSETSHSEGELYMPSSCSYSLGEVRVLRSRRDLLEDNAMDRDSSVTVLVTRSMLTSLNDSTAVSGVSVCRQDAGMVPRDYKPSFPLADPAGKFRTRLRTDPLRRDGVTPRLIVDGADLLSFSDDFYSVSCDNGLPLSIRVECSVNVATHLRYCRKILYLIVVTLFLQYRWNVSCCNVAAILLECPTLHEK
ncbi:PREDICTED: uncharacterized protein LOC105569798 [Vollenhovia emeryi]|uniref:uncharacterized protein LOC105569798 n=1 Tax=Vollenhovia emeryi TaxID=411798 RepID=UPI0005F36DB9|nr:PREDICTED: uncharacterized protein LOC105569798 [Vollenhovia emeryi]